MIALLAAPSDRDYLQQFDPAPDVDDDGNEIATPALMPPINAEALMEDFAAALANLERPQ